MVIALLVELALILVLAGLLWWALRQAAADRDAERRQTDVLTRAIMAKDLQDFTRSVRTRPMVVRPEEEVIRDRRRQMEDQAARMIEDMGDDAVRPKMPSGLDGLT